MKAAFLVGMAILLMGCSSNSAQVDRTESALLSKGTPITLMLMERLDSGGTKVGTLVHFVVSQPVVDENGRILVPVGTTVTGEITQSRAAGALSSVLNSPARLRMKLLPIELERGSPVPLSGVSDSQEDFGFTGDSVEAPNEKLKEAIGDDAKRRVLESMADLIEGTRSWEEVKSELGSDSSLRQLLQDVGLSDSNELMEKGESLEKGFSRVLSSLNQLKKGDVSSIASGDLMLAVAALEELGGLAADIRDSVKGVFKGRNIRPTVGSTIEVFVAVDRSITLVKG